MFIRMFTNTFVSYIAKIIREAKIIFWERIIPDAMYGKDSNQYLSENSKLKFCY